MGIKVSKVKHTVSLDTMVERSSLTNQEISIHKAYKFGKIIGAGNFGVVREAFPTDSLIKVAIKAISKGMKGFDIKKASREVAILKSIDHPNIIRFNEAYEDDRNIFIVSEHCQGGHLWKKMITQRKLTEIEAQIYINQMLLAINYLHLHKIVHRDIKPENFLFVSPDHNELKLIDFGFAKKYNKFSSMRKCLGTSYYMAPEVLKGNYNQKCDEWGIGVIMYTMLCGELPFYSKDLHTAFEQIKKGAFCTTSENWDQISLEGKDLIGKLLSVNPSKRISAKKALNHPWFRTMTNSDPLVDGSLISSFQEYCKSSVFHKEILNMMIKYMTFSEIREINQLFLNFDKEKKGEISIKSFTRFLQSSLTSISIDTIKNLLKEIDTDKDGIINYTEFLAAAVSSIHQFTQDEIWFIFDQFDSERKGFITPNDIRRTLQRSGCTIEKDIESKLLKDIGRKNIAKIDFKGFLDIFTNGWRN
ncbi:unnamed protein product [Blepharisma stoltei]|uniref:Calcium-dependent protein kinase n=1 Tax=Blepharisma stoltei TaxID=1481888 RepID=A0AAU9JNZ9_9CILI|nr:unnamed protein product [Blepharisma stoltei]